MKHSVLLVEDDQDIAGLLLVHLQELGLNVVHCVDGESAIRKMNEQSFQIALLDIMLPGGDGLSLCR
jgi:DNA-binding response OmpR family regulator